MQTQGTLFDITVQARSCDELTAEAEAAVYALYEASSPVAIAFSGGKDSSVTLNIALVMARKARESGLHPFVMVTSSDTLVENPEIAWHIRDEHRKVRQYAAKHGIDVVTSIVQPSLSQSFQVRVLSGRGLPSYAGVRSDCSTDWKINPQIRERRALFRQLSRRGLKEPVTLLGTRFGESQKRDIAMTVRGDRHDLPVRNKDGDLVMSPIAHFTTDHVWEYLGMAGNSLIDSYSDFEDCRRIYAASVGTSCVVVADAIMDGRKTRVGKCGARHGCWSCLQATDRSLEAMVEFTERYAYARGLVKLNRYLRAIRHDWSRRHWIGRTIRAGYISIQPDTFHPAEIRNLTRFMLQLDFDERQRVAREGGRVMFQILPLEAMIAVDALQSLQGIAKPFACWADLRDIEQLGIRYDIPELPAVAATDIPAARFLHVGNDWDDNSSSGAWNGLRDPMVEQLTADSPCAQPLVDIGEGRLTWKMDTTPTFDVDAESALMIEEFERDRLVEMHDRGFPTGSICAAYRWYLQFGVLQLSHAHQVAHDDFARRTTFKDRAGLTLDYSIRDLLAKTVPFSALPSDAIRAWSGKATTETAQTDMYEDLAPA